MLKVYNYKSSNSCKEKAKENAKTFKLQKIFCFTVKNILDNFLL